MQGVKSILARFRQQLIQIMNLQRQDKSYETASSFMDTLTSQCCCRKLSVTENIHRLSFPLPHIQLPLSYEIEVFSIWLTAFGFSSQAEWAKGPTERKTSSVFPLQVSETLCVVSGTCQWVCRSSSLDKLNMLRFIWATGLLSPRDFLFL